MRTFSHQGRQPTHTLDNGTYKRQSGWESLWIVALVEAFSTSRIKGGNETRVERWRPGGGGWEII